MSSVDLNLRDVPFFKGLTDSELAAVKECLHEKKFAKGENLFLEGASCSRVFFVRSGRVKLYRLGASGREQILQTLGPGDTCACNPGQVEWSCASTAEALAETKAWFLSRPHYMSLVQTNSILARSLNRLFADRIRCLSSLLEEVSLKDSRKRIVKFLLDMQGAGDVVSIPFTREELAQRLGLARETVARQLHQLKKNRLIEIRPHAIRLRDRDALKRVLEA